MPYQKNSILRFRLNGENSFQDSEFSSMSKYRILIIIYSQGFGIVTYFHQSVSEFLRRLESTGRPWVNHTNINKYSIIQVYFGRGSRRERIQFFYPSQAWLARNLDLNQDFLMPKLDLTRPKEVKFRSSSMTIQWPLTKVTSWTYLYSWNCPCSCCSCPWLLSEIFLNLFTFLNFDCYRNNRNEDPRNL